MLTSNDLLAGLPPLQQGGPDDATSTGQTGPITAESLLANLPPLPDSEGSQLTPESGPVTALRALRGDLPAAVGSLAGTAVGIAGGGLAGIETGPGAIATAVAGGIAGHAAGSAIGEEAKLHLMGKDWVDKDIAQQQANAEAHPYWDAAGRAIPMLISLSKGGGVATTLARNAAKKAGEEATASAIASGASKAAATIAGREAAESAAEAIGKQMAVRIADSAAAGAGMGAAEQADNLVHGKDTTVGDFADSMARDAIGIGAIGAIGANGALPHVESLFKTVGMAVPQAITMEIANSAYDAIVHNKPFDAEEVAKRGGAQIIPFAIFNAISHGVQSGRQQLAENPKLKEELQDRDKQKKTQKTSDVGQTYVVSPERSEELSELAKKKVAGTMDADDQAELARVMAPGNNVEQEHFIGAVQEQENIAKAKAELSKQNGWTDTTLPPVVPLAPVVPAEVPAATVPPSSESATSPTPQPSSPPVGADLTPAPPVASIPPIEMPQPPAPAAVPKPAQIDLTKARTALTQLTQPVEPVKPNPTLEDYRNSIRNAAPVEPPKEVIPAVEPKPVDAEPAPATIEPPQTPEPPKEVKPAVTDGVTETKLPWQKVKPSATSNDIYMNAEGAFEASAGDKSVSTGEASFEKRLAEAGKELRKAEKERDQSTIKGDPEEARKTFLEKINFLKVRWGNETGIERTGVGQQTAKAYEPLRGMTPEQAKARVYDDSAAKGKTKEDGTSGNGGKNGATTRKLVALRSPDDSHVVLGQAYRTSKIERVTMYDDNGKPKVRNYDELIKEGWQPLATVKQRDYSKNFIATYSPEGWKELEHSLFEKEAKVRESAVAFAEQLDEMANEAGRPNGSRSEAAKESSPTTVSDPSAVGSRPTGEASSSETAHAFTSDHAEEMFDALHLAEVESADKVLDVLSSAGLNRVFRLFVMDNFEMGNKKQALEAVTNAKRFIYETFNEASKLGSSEGRLGFASRLLEGKGGKRNESPVPSPVLNPDAGSAGGAAGAGRAGAGAEAGASKNSPDEQARIIRHRAEATVKALRTSPAVVRLLIPRLIHALRAQGVDVRKLAPEVAQMTKDCAKLESWQDGEKGELHHAITLAMDDVNNPNHDSLIGLLHEAGHVVFANETSEMQALLHQAIEGATNEHLGIGDYKERVEDNPEAFSTKGGKVSKDVVTPERVQQEGRLVEALARQLAASGFDQVASQGIIKRIGNAMMALYNRVVMGMAKAMGLPPSPDRALKYYQYRMKSFLSGGDPMSFMSFMGGPRMKEIDYSDPANFTPTVRNRLVSDTNPEVSKDFDSHAVNEPNVAAHGELFDVLKGVHKQAHEEGVFIEPVPLDKLMKQIGLPGEVGGITYYKTGETPETKIGEINKAIADLGDKRQAEINPDTRVSDIAGESARKMAAMKAHNLIDLTRTFLGAKLREAKRELYSLINQHKRGAEQFQKLLKNKNDLDATWKDARNKMHDLLTEAVIDAKEIRDTFKRATGASRKSGILEKQLRDISDDIKGENLPQRYIDALNSMDKGLGGGSEDLSDTLQKMAEVMADKDGDWDKLSAKQIRDGLLAEHEDIEGGHLLKPLLENTPESRVKLATAIAFAKANTHHMDLLAIRQANKAGEQHEMYGEISEANKILNAALEDRDSAIDDAKEFARKLPTMAKKMARLLTSIERLKAQNKQKLNRIEELKTFEKVATLADPMLRAAMIPHEVTAGIIWDDFNVVHGAKLRVPQNHDSKPENFVETTLNLNANGTTTAEVKEALNRMLNWLKLGRDGEPNKALLATHGADYLQVLHNYNVLEQHEIGWGIHRDIQGSFVNRFIGPITERLKMVGTPLARISQTMIEHSQRLSRENMTQTHQFGSEWEVNRMRAMKALGLARTDVFDKTILRQWANFLENRKDLQAIIGNDKAAKDVAIKEGLDYLTSDKSEFTRDMMSKPGARATVEKWMRKHIEIADWSVKNGNKMGNKVKDGKYYRDVLGSAPFTLPRRLSGEAESQFHKMTLWAGDPMTAQYALREIKTKGIENLRLDLKAKFEQAQWFAKEVCTNRQGRSLFYAPGNDNVFAQSENVRTAYEQAGGAAGFDAIEFARHLYALEGGRGDADEKEVFLSKVLGSFQGSYDLLSAMRGDYADAQSKCQPTPKRYIMDARKCEDAPAGFYDYLPLDKTTLSQITRSQAYHAAFGRGMEAMRNNLFNAEKEQRDLADKYENMKLEHPGLTGGDLKKALRSDMKAQGINRVIMEEASRNAKTIAQCTTSFNALLSINQNRPPEMQSFSELMGAIAGLTVSGPATAITAHAVIWEQGFRKFGFNMAGLRATLGVTKDIGGVALNSLLQAFHYQTAQDADYVRLLNLHGVFDDDATMSRKDKWESVWSHPTYTNNPISHGAIIAARLAKTALTTGFGRAQEGKGIFPTLKPLSAFHWAAQVIQMGGAIRFAKTYEAAVMRGIEHFEANPEHAADNNFEFEAKHLGMPEGRPFDYLTQSMVKYGMSFEQLARDAMKRRESNPTAPLLKDKMYGLVAQQSLDDMTMESSLTTRPEFLMTNSLGQMANPMLGWAIQKSYDACRGFREPTGKASMNGFRTGLLAYAAILPIGLAFAMLRNKFDEDVLGRKYNVEDVSNIHDAHSAFSIILDNAARIGTFGIAGEIPNYWVNQDSGVRPLSIDNRIFFVSTILNTQKAVMNLVHQQSFDYPTVVRPLIQALGGNGFIQYAGALNHMLTLDNQEARVAGRISVNNYLRVAGRETNLDVRVMNGPQSGMSATTPMKPYIGQMVMAAYANDAKGFQEARKNALREAMTAVGEDKRMVGKDKVAEAQRRVAQAYQDSNPLQTVFKTRPTEMQYRKALEVMDSQGKESVSTALRLFQHYGSQTGASGNLFAKPAGDVVQRTTPLTLDDARRRAF